MSTSTQTTRTSTRSTYTQTTQTSTISTSTLTTQTSTRTTSGLESEGSSCLKRWVWVTPQSRRNVHCSVHPMFVVIPHKTRSYYHIITLITGKFSNILHFASMLFHAFASGNGRVGHFPTDKPLSNESVAFACRRAKAQQPPRKIPDLFGVMTSCALAKA